MNRLLHAFLTRTIKKGRLDVIDSSGATHHFGDGTGAPVRIRFNSAAAERAVLLDPELQLGEQYMNRGYDIEVGSILDFLTLLLVNIGGSRPTWWTRALSSARSIFRSVFENNEPTRAQDNVHRHYDLDAAPLCALSRRRPAILVRLFRGWRHRS